MQTFESDFYRYGYQSQEKDDDWNGQGATYAFKYRIHDARLGRFLSIDPLMNDYPWNSPYAFAENMVIRYGELEGRERWDIFTEKFWMTPLQLRTHKENETGWERTQVHGENLARSVANVVPGTIKTVDTFIHRGTGAVIKDFQKGFRKLEETVTSDYDKAKREEGIESLSGYLKDRAQDPNVQDAILGTVAQIVVAKKLAPKVTVLRTGIVTTRKNLASAFYNKFGEANIPSKMKGIDFTKAVQTKILKKGTKIQQWVDPKQGTGKYFSPTGSSKNVGVTNMGGRVLKTFELLEDTKVLKSTTSNFNGAKGGAVQYFSPDLKVNAVEIVPGG